MTADFGIATRKTEIKVRGASLAITFSVSSIGTLSTENENEEEFYRIHLLRMRFNL